MRPAVVVEALSKIFGDSLDTRYEPAVSVFALLRERRGEAAARRIPSDPLEDEDEDEEDDDLGLEPDTPAELHDVSFDVQPGEAVGIVGDAPGARTLARILCGMTAPSSGRIVVCGRVAPSVELATLLIRRETSARSAARLLAVLAGPGRRHRRAYVNAAFELALGDDATSAGLARAPKPLLRQLAAAAALEPFADVLVVDMLPPRGDAGFRERCLARLVQRLAAGVAVVVTAQEPDLLRLCGRIVRLEQGSVAEIGFVGERVETGKGEDDDQPDPEVDASAAPVMRGFDRHAAILAVSAVDQSGVPIETARSENDLQIRVVFETATAAEVMVVIRLAGETDSTFVREKAPLAPGTYVATCRLPPAALEPGDYDIAVGLVLEHEERTKVGRRRAATVRVEGDAEAIVVAAESGLDVGGPGALGPPEPEWTLEPG